MKRLIFLSIMLVVTVAWGETKTYCDKCHNEFTPESTFTLTIKIGDRTQDVSSDLCGKCLTSLVNDLSKYKLNITTAGWSDADIITIPHGGMPEYLRMKPL